VPPPALPASGVIKVSAPKPVTYSRRSTAGFTEGFDTPVLQDAKALLDELRGQSAVISSDQSNNLALIP
jgi:hypothetical protein